MTPEGAGVERPSGAALPRKVRVLDELYPPKILMGGAWITAACPECNSHKHLGRTVYRTRLPGWWWFCNRCHVVFCVDYEEKARLCFLQTRLRIYYDRHPGWKETVERVIAEGATLWLERRHSSTVEQRFRKPQVGGSNPPGGSN